MGRDVDVVASKFGVCKESRQMFRCEEVTRGDGVFLEFEEQQMRVMRLSTDLRRASRS